jgi:hypothetical protein
MPYEIRKGSECGATEFGVYKRDTGELVACHKTEKLAQSQFRLLEMMAHNEKKNFKAAISPCHVPNGAKQAAERGLKLRAEFKRGGTAVGANRARQLIRSSQVSPAIARRIYSYFKRHEVDKRASGFHQGGDGYPSAGLIAWLLWGGDAMFSAVKTWHEHHDK